MWACREGRCQPTCPSAGGQELAYCEARPGDCSTGYCAISCDSRGDSAGQPEASPPVEQPAELVGPTSSTQLPGADAGELLSPNAAVPTTASTDSQRTADGGQPEGVTLVGPSLGTQSGAPLEAPSGAEPQALAVPFFVPPRSGIPEIAAAQEIGGKARTAKCELKVGMGPRLCPLAF